MYKKVFFLIFAATLAMSDGVQPTNYEISRNQLGGNNYGSYPYPVGPGQYGQGQYGGQFGHGPHEYGNGYPPYYPNNQYTPPGPPGAHPGCPLCDSSVYSYCSHKQDHDACCCSNVFNYNCGKADCKFLYANSCDEHHLITKCCCVDLYKNNANTANLVPVVV